MNNFRFSFANLIIFAAVFTANIFAQNNFPDVTLYKDSKYSGEFLFVKPGNIRFTGKFDFNDLTSSVEVPKGFVAVIYENADDKGGFGKSVDLMENCEDLSKFDLNDKISYISVFSAERPGFNWVRGRYNGKGGTATFMPGHWERQRADGTMPDNSRPAVSPGTPSNIPTVTVIQRNDAAFTLTSIGEQTSIESQSYSLAETLMGVIGSDYKGAEEIGSAAFERASNNFAIPDNINFWYPQKSPRDNRNRFFKRTLSGIIPGGEFQPQIAEIEGTYEDHDFNLDIVPSPNYMNLISDGHKPDLSTPQAIKLRGKSLGLSNPTGSFTNPCTKPFTVVEAEIDARLNAKSALNFLARQRIGKQIAVYGAWIYDIGHCYQPEIHPAEQIWWSENEGNNKKYNLNIFCDSSKRFWYRSQMDDGTKMKPWGAPPITGTFAIAFEVEIGQGGKFDLGGFSKPGKKFEVSNIEDFNVVANPNSNKVYNLIYQNNVLVSFVPHNDAFKVSFEKVGYKPGTTNIVRGFLVIEATVGTVTQISNKITVEFPASGGIKPPPIQIAVPAGATAENIDEKYEKQVFKKAEGHYMFSILRSDLPAKTPLNLEFRTQ